MGIYYNFLLQSNNNTINLENIKGSYGYYSLLCDSVNDLQIKFFKNKLQIFLETNKCIIAAENIIRYINKMDYKYLPFIKYKEKILTFLEEKIVICKKYPNSKIICCTKDICEENIDINKIKEDFINSKQFYIKRLKEIYKLPLLNNLEIDNICLSIKENISDLFKVFGFGKTKCNNEYFNIGSNIYNKISFVIHKKELRIKEEDKKDKNDFELTFAKTYAIKDILLSNFLNTSFSINFKDDLFNDTIEGSFIYDINDISKARKELYDILYSYKKEQTINLKEEYLSLR